MSVPGCCSPSSAQCVPRAVWGAQYSGQRSAGSEDPFRQRLVCLKWKKSRLSKTRRARGSGSLRAPPGCIPQCHLRPLSTINAICIGIGCNKSCKSLTAERTPPGADSAEPGLLELWQCVNGIFCWGEGGDWWQLDDTYLALWCVFTQTTFSSGTRGIKKSSFPTLYFWAALKRSRMTKAPFSVEWLSQSSQAPRSPTQGTPRRASPSAAGRRLSSGSKSGLSERSKEKGSGKGGRSSREPSTTPPTAGNRGHRLTLGWEGCLNCVPLPGAREGIAAGR